MAVGVVLLAAGCTVAPPPATPTTFPAGAAFDYQLGSAYAPPGGTRIVARDSTATPVEGAYNICYLNAFQTQPGVDRKVYDGLLLTRADGGPFIDPGWPDEVIFDTSSAANRAALLAIEKPWIDSCAAKGFDAVEGDNLDTWTRSDGQLSRADNLALAGSLVAYAHSQGLMFGQKNAAELGKVGRDDVGFDFAITEECAQYDECTAYTDVYGKRVLDIEYVDATETPFTEACSTYSSTLSMIQRDRELVGPTSTAYAYARCP